MDGFQDIRWDEETLLKKGNIQRVKFVLGAIFSADFEQLIFRMRPGVIITTKRGRPSKKYEEKVGILTLILNILTGRGICYFMLPLSNLTMVLFTDQGRMVKFRQEISNIIQTLEGKPREVLLHRVFGKFCGYPTCCINKYIEDLSDKPQFLSEAAARRYKTQLGMTQTGKKTDPFNVMIKKDKNTTRINSLLGFIPCSPDCKKALKLRSKYLSLYPS